MPILFRGCNIDDAFLREADLMNRFVGQELWNWGGNTWGQLGTSDAVNRSSPVQTISGGTNWAIMSAGYNAGRAIKTDGTLWLWGRGLSGRFGNNSAVDRSSPVQTISGGNNWRRVAGDLQGSSVATKTDGTLWTWGSNTQGTLGDNTNIAKSSPVQTISGGTNWKDISGGFAFMAATKTDGTLWTWGAGAIGQLGTNSTSNQSSPVQTISGGTNWKSINVARCNGSAIKTDGTLWVWGLNTARGQLGNLDTINQSSPVQTVSATTNWKSSSVGFDSMAAIKTDGTLWMWGSGGIGKLGNNNTIDVSSPVQTISGGTNWRTSCSGNLNVAGIKTDSTLWIWGSGALTGSIGDNTTINKSSPIQTIAGGTNWRCISLSPSDTMVSALKITGE